MKDEIKEILDNLKYTAKKHTIQVLENGGKIEHCPQEIETEIRLNTYSANILFNYITNLQKIEQDHQKLNGELREELEDYKLRNEKAICYLASCDWNKKEFVDLYDILQGDDK